MNQSIISLALVAFSFTANAIDIPEAIVNEEGIRLEIPYFTMAGPEGDRAFKVILSSPPEYNEPEFALVPGSLQELPLREATYQSVEVLFQNGAYDIVIPYLDIYTLAGNSVFKLKLLSYPNEEDLKLFVDWTSIQQFELTFEEIEGLLYMREEEKLARDVYITMYKAWGQRIFDNISRSEQTHMGWVLDLLENYNLDDPVKANEIGEFVNPVLQNFYDDLVTKGSQSLIDALMVGAAIEEIDIIDIQNNITLIEDNPDIVAVYENLIKGSENHLRAFVKNIEKQGVSYEPQYLEQDDYDAIINDAR